MRLFSRFVIAVVTASVAALVTVAPASAEGSEGAPGIGDPYYPNMGNGGYDVADYKIALTYAPVFDLLTGTTTILATATQDLSSFNLDFLLDVSSVKVNGLRATVTQSKAEGEMTVRPPAVLPRGGEFTVTVNYSGIPSKVTAKPAWYDAWRLLPDGAVSSGQPYQADLWYPSNNHPADKATHSISITVPRGVEALSNGVLEGVTNKPENMVEWRWRSERPQVTYASLLAIGQYEIQYATSPTGLPVITAYSQLINDDNAKIVREDVGHMPTILDYYANVFGEYPFEAQGYVVAFQGNTPGYGLEAQTRPVLSDNVIVHFGRKYVVAHELAHQWFGVSASFYGWKDLWLSEGLATYAEAVLSEGLGEGTADQLVKSWYDRFAGNPGFWEVLPGDPCPGRGRQFHLAVYYRTAIGLHAMRKAVGDEDFFATLRTWAQQKQHGNGTAEEFIALSERISGTELGDLFKTWLYTPGKPPLPTVSATASETPPASLEHINKSIEWNAEQSAPSEHCQ